MNAIKRDRRCILSADVGCYRINILSFLYIRLRYFYERDSLENFWITQEQSAGMDGSETEHFSEITTNHEITSRDPILL